MKKYTENHEWAEMTPQESVRVGITDHAQEQLGDIIFIELPEIGANFAQGDEMATLESVKAASEVYAPVSGEIIAVNEQLRDTPALLNSGAEGDGWIAEIKIADKADMEKLMDAEKYQTIKAAH